MESCFYFCYHFYTYFTIYSMVIIPVTWLSLNITEFNCINTYIHNIANNWKFDYKSVAKNQSVFIWKCMQLSLNFSSLVHIIILLIDFFFHLHHNFYILGTEISNGEIASYYFCPINFLKQTHLTSLMLITNKYDRLPISQ